MLSWPLVIQWTARILTNQRSHRCLVGARQLWHQIGMIVKGVIIGRSLERQLERFLQIQRDLFVFREATAR